MSSGTPEPYGHNPQDWQSPYGSHENQDPYRDHPSHAGPHGTPGGTAPYDQGGHPGPGHAPYDQGQAPYDHRYAAPGQSLYGDQQPYGTPAYPPAAYGATGQGQPYPYGYDPSYGYDPYQQPYQHNPYGYPPRPGGDGPRTHAIVALVVSIVLGLSCYVSLGGIAGAIIAGVALGKVDTEPQRARSLLKWVWISIGINISLLVLSIGGLLLLGAGGHP